MSQDQTVNFETSIQTATPDFGANSNSVASRIGDATAKALSYLGAAAATSCGVIGTGAFAVEAVDMSSPSALSVTSALGFAGIAWFGAQSLVVNRRSAARNERPTCNFRPQRLRGQRNDLV